MAGRLLTDVTRRAIDSNHLSREGIDWQLRCLPDADYHPQGLIVWDCQ
jgi:hypothetical protein